MSTCEHASGKPFSVAARAVNIITNGAGPVLVHDLLSLAADFHLIRMIEMRIEVRVFLNEKPLPLKVQHSALNVQHSWLAASIRTGPGAR